MNRSRHVTHPRAGRAADALSRRRQVLTHLPLASAISAVLAGVPVAYAQQKGDTSGALEEVVVTAQKKSENIQDVPVSIQALGTEKLEELHINNLDDYVKYLPGVTTVKGLGQGGNGIGTTHVYMRGVVSGQDGNHSASQPSVGTYIDEQPVTTIDGTVDLHVYDIERVEVLEGPQGTLYGASSEAGTIRIITNKADPKAFKAGYDLGLDNVHNGSWGSSLEGFVNLPLSPVAAVRLVGWDIHDGGYINNVAGTNAAAGIVNGTRTFVCKTGCEASTTTLSNGGSTRNAYNGVATKGGRGSLRVNLGDNWTVTPSFMGQVTNANGFFGYDPAVGDLKLVHFGPESTHDSFTQAALTVEGKINDFDIVYAGALMNRHTESIADYSDYSYFYDKYYGSGTYWNNAAGQSVMPQEFVIDKGRFVKWSNELRVTTPQRYPVKATVGLFAQRQLHDIWQQYTMPGLGGNPLGGNPQGFDPALSIPGWPNTIWLTDLERVDRDQAAFGQVTWDITDQWAVTGGMRYFKAKNSLEGFYGYSGAYQDLTGYHSGMQNCGGPGAANYTYKPFKGAPCTNLDQGVDESGHTERVNVSYKFDPDRMVYATYSTGFRPGGVNRVFDAAINAIFPPYKADFLKNYELGWKTRWANRHVKWNGAVFQENWSDFQFSFLGPNSVTVVQNASSAKIKGIETDLEWSVGGGLLLGASATYLNAKLTSDFCGTFLPGTTTLNTSCPTQVNGPSSSAVTFADGTRTVGPLASTGDPLPVVPKVKSNVLVRYGFGLGDWEANVQGTWVYQTSARPLLRTVDWQHLGEMPAFSLVDLSTGIEKNGLSLQLIIANVFDERAQLTRFAQCTPTSCSQTYVIPSQPRTIGVKFGQKF
jgi:iron complex outermembrane recepter protein